MASDASYSYSLTTFSRSGKLLQIEYALTAVGEGKTSIGIKAKNGVVLITDKKIQNKLVDVQQVKKLDPSIFTKSGIMVGLGESDEEVGQLMDDLRSADVDFMTIGQYLRPSMSHLAIDRFYRPEEFEELRKAGVDMGFKHVASGPLVRSSYHADEQHDAAAMGMPV